MKYRTHSLAFWPKLREINRAMRHIAPFAKCLPVSDYNGYMTFTKKKLYEMNLTEILSFSLPSFLLSKQDQ